MRAWLLALPAVLALVPASGEAADVPPVQLALDGAADLSPVYPTVTIPANEHDFVAIFTCGDQNNHLIKTEFTPIDATGSYRITREARAEVAPIATGTRFLVRQPFLTDLPVGRWSMTASVDGKAVGTVEFKVVAPASPVKLSSPTELMGSLSEGSEWNYKFRFLAEPRPGLKMTMDGIQDADAEGWLNTTLQHRIVSLDPDGARREQRRGNGPAESLWLVPTDRGLAATKSDQGNGPKPFEPAQLMALAPNEQFHRDWRWLPKGAPPELALTYKMWGPLPVKTSRGEQPGYVVLQRVPDPHDPAKVATSVEYHYAPGPGLVHEVIVNPIAGADAAVRIELDLTTMKRGSGPEPEIRPYSDSP
jgi:hypothetical protein